jgi:outer membrane lipoprotein-sorting protein
MKNSKFKVQNLKLELWVRVLGISFVAISARAAETAPVLQKFLSSQTNLLTWSADFTQIRHYKSLSQPLASTGHVWFAAPNKFRWELGSPAQTIAVRGADAMLVIYPQLKRVEKYPLTGDRMDRWKDMLALLEAGFPRSEADLEKQFKVLSVSPSNGVENVALQPKVSAARRMMPQISLAFATNNFELRATEMQFSDGSTMRNEFRNSVLNPKLDEALFVPKLEADFKVVEPMKK